MADNLFNTVYNPDVLSCLANLSNDEVFTPPNVVNQMLDMLPQELFRNPDITFLDPACKTGVFLREIAKRLIEGLEPQIPDLEERIEHIFHKQLYAIAITELTSLLSRRGVYCSKYPQSEFSVTQFDDAEGNIRFRKIQHKWKDGKCIFCGASQAEYERDSALETHAYEFIHIKKPEEIFNMKFDVIIGNPPYQLSDGGYGKSARPIYHFFIERAKKLNPRYLSMVIPSRWFSGGRGLEEFRKSMLTDKHIRTLVDYENFKDIFPGVDLAGGACYFLWDRDNPGECNVINCTSGTESISAMRYLDEFDVFIRSNRALSIVRKVCSAHDSNFIDKTVSASKPFGLRTFYEPRKSGIPCQFIQRIGLQYADPSDVEDSLGLLNKWKILAPRSPIAGQTDFSKPVSFYYDGNTRIVPPGTCCTESFLVLYAANSEDKVKSFRTYLYTKVVRFLLLQCVVSQDVTRDKFRFVPDLGDYEGEYSDAMLCERWKISDEEWAFIDSRIGEIRGDSDGN
jgi:site-specific DNA-methyltransferase (adenine-specific)